MDRAIAKSSSARGGSDDAIQQKKNTAAFAYITALFFIWGFITCLNDILIPHLKSLFSLSYAEAMLVQFSFFSAYFFFSIPAGRIVKHYGYPQGINIGLGIAGTGAVLFFCAGLLTSYAVFLAALFILACGITLLQVAANPYTSALGPEESASARLNFVQGFNSLGTTLAPLAGSYLILSQGRGDAPAGDGTWQTFLPYLGIGALLFVLVAVLQKLGLPPYTDASFSTPEDLSSKKRSIWSYPQLVLGIAAIFAYVGAEVCIGSFLVNYMESSWGLAAEHAGKYASFYWGGAMVGRFVGTYFLNTYPAESCLKVVVCFALALVGAAMITPTTISPACLLVVGLFNAIMFPVIFSLSIRGLGIHTSQGASYLCMAIVGGAILPFLQGHLADAFTVQISFALPLLAYAYVFFFASKVTSFNRSGPRPKAPLAG